MSDSHIIFERPQPEIVMFLLNRPEKKNALTLSMIENLHSQIDKIESDHSIRALIISSKHASFCTGLDLQEIQDPLTKDKCLNSISGLFRRIYTLPFITIAGIDGVAVAGGAGLACSCDFIIASTISKLGFPEVHRGLIPALVIAILKRKITESYLRELVLLGESVDARRLKEMGLIHRIVNPSEVIKSTLAFANKAIKGAPRAIKRTKQLINGLSPTLLEDDFKKSLEFHHMVQADPEHFEGVRAFLEKRPPNWN